MPNTYLKKYLKTQADLIKKIKTNSIVNIYKSLAKLSKNNKVFIFGNGGSAAVASHFALDLSNNSDIKCFTLPDMSMISCLSNDYGYENLFSKYLTIYGNKDDILKKIDQTKNKNISIMIQKKWKEKYKNRFDHPKSQADKVFINEKGYVKKISKNLPEKHTNGEFLGILKIPKNSIKTIKIYLDLLKKNENIKRYQFHNYLNFLIKNRVQIKSCNTIKKFMEIDTLNDYKIAKTLFEN